jgi:replicative DNA helicase
VSDFIGLGNIAHLFKGGNEAELFKYTATHLKKFAKLPTIATVEAHTKLDIEVAQEPWDYYFDILQKRHIEVTLKSGMKEAAEHLQSEDKDAQAALVKLTETVMGLIRTQTQSEIVDFRDAYDAVISEYASAYSGGSDYGFRFGWPTIDGMTGGLTKGDLASIVGRPSRGKTWQLLHAALYQWLEAGKAKLADPKADIPCEHSRLFASNEEGVSALQSL